MRRANKGPVEIPSMEQIEKERSRLQYRSRYSRTLRSTIAVLLVVAAMAVLVATLWMPVLRIYGTSMVPTLEDGQIVISVKTESFEPGDIAAFYLGNKVLVKRYIAGPGEWINLDESGNVFINGEPLDEPYLTEKSYGQTNIELPYQYRTNGIFSWVITVKHPSTPAIQRWAAWKKSRSSERSYSASGP